MFGLSGHRPSYPVLGPRLSASQKLSTSSTSSYLMVFEFMGYLNHVDLLLFNVFLTFNVLLTTSSYYMVFEFMGYLNHVDLLLPHVYIHGYICFKKTALLFNVHLSCLVSFFLCQLTNICSKLTNLFLVIVVTLSTSKTTNSEKTTYF